MSGNRAKAMRESLIEQTVSKFAKRNGWLTFKWVSPNNRGVPDRLFFRAGQLVLVEFKATGQKLTKLQALVHKKLEGEGFRVHVVDSIEEGIALFA